MTLFSCQKRERFMRLFGKMSVHNSVGLCGFQIWYISKDMTQKYLNLWQHFGNFWSIDLLHVAMNVSHIEHEIRSYSAWLSLTWAPPHISLEFPNKAFLRYEFQIFRKNAVLRSRLYSRLCFPNSFIDGNIILSSKDRVQCYKTGIHDPYHTTAPCFSWLRWNVHNNSTLWIL